MEQKKFGKFFILNKNENFFNSNDKKFCMKVFIILFNYLNKILESLNFLRI